MKDKINKIYHLIGGIIAVLGTWIIVLSPIILLYVLCNWKIHWLIIIGVLTLVVSTLTVITIKALNYAYTEKDNKFYVLFRKFIGV